ncbi:hypothetical protein AFLA_009297 [Aspergillus flavus NRRL3357]|nr:hypothetical protein AFLA_009297 [Aspergillus flavus NRRL3357]
MQGSTDGDCCRSFNTKPGSIITPSRLSLCRLFCFHFHPASHIAALTWEFNLSVSLLFVVYFLLFFFRILRLGQR